MAYNSTIWLQDSKTKGTSDVTETLDQILTGTLTADKVKLSGNVIQASDGGDTITLDASDNVTIAGDLTTKNATFQAASGQPLNVNLNSDAGEDNSDKWQLSIADAGVLDLNSYISGSFTSHLKITPNSTIGSSIIQVPGNLKVGNTIINSNNDTNITLPQDSADVTIGGDLTVTGNDIKSSSATAITLSGANTSLLGTLDVASTINLGANSYMTLDQNSITISSGNLTIDADGDITLEADGDNIHFTVSGTEVMELDANSRVSCSNADAGSYNTLFGFQAGALIASGDDYNTFIGYGVADADMTDATYNTAVGYLALSALTTGDSTVAIGARCGTAITTGTQNIFIGASSGIALTEGSRNIAIGNSALSSADNTEGRNIAIGYEALKDLDSPSGTSLYNIGIGYQALTALTDATFNVAVGDLSGKVLTTGTKNTFLGYGAGRELTADGDNVCLGYSAFSAAGVDDGEKNVVIGSIAMQNHNYAASDRNVVIGYGAAKGGTAGVISKNVVLGTYALDNSSVAASSGVYIGYNCAGDAAVTGTANNIIGDGAGASLTNGAYNNIIGKSAGDAVTSSGGNSVLGHNALGAETDGQYNVAIGYEALKVANTDNSGTATNSFNTMVGYQAGDAISTGQNNTGFGASVAFTIDADNQTAIGYGATTDSANDIAIGNTSVDEVKGQVDFSTFSDERIKTNIIDGDLGLDFINLLKPRKFNKVNPAEYPDSIKKSTDGLGTWTDAQSNKVWDGLIAQEVKSAIDSCSTTFSGWGEESNSKQLVTYSTLVIPLIKAVQELSAQVEELKSKLGE